MAKRVRAVYHGHYNVRDQRGHYVKPKTARGHICHHLCCNGTRVHPDKLPVKISRSYLRTLSEPQLERELDTYSNYSETHEEGFLQVLAELDRRDTAERKGKERHERADARHLRSLSDEELSSESMRRGWAREPDRMQISRADEELARREHKRDVADARKQRAYERRQQRNQEHSDEVYRQWLMAEAATNGNMLNKAGKKADINERSLFTGPESRVRAYASRELLDFFQEHPRQTRAAFYGTASQRRAAYAGRGFGGSA